jgi:uncharacterized protein DUF4953/uncharacterized protein DUF5117/uncharacterized protein DUF5118
MKRVPLILAFIGFGLAAAALAQEPPTSAGQEPQTPQRREAPPEPRPYERVITRDAKSDPGVFTVHRIGDRLLYEIPKSELGKDFLWVSQIAKTTLGVGYGGQAAGNRVVKWERRNNRVLLKSVSYEVVADPSLPIAKAVDAANNDTIIAAFNVEAIGKDDAVVIDVTRLFTSEVPEFSVRSRVRARTFDQNRSFVERAVSFPENIEVEATHTFTSPPADAPQAGGPPGPGRGGAPQAARVGSATVLMHYSMVKLPEKPMMPRLFDERVGYFTTSQMDYGQDEHRAPRRRYIARYRLEKKDPTAAVSEPIKPITYWVDPATPAKWVPWIKKGVEDWQEAFEEAGFRKAIVAREAPSPSQDPDWSPEDARYSVIRWLPSTTENASGPHISDPRTGEIIEADIQFYHNVMNLQRDWYFVQVGPLDPRAQKLPLPDDLMGRLLEYVVAHEVGHTLGFQHNMKSSATYDAAKVRDKDWVHKMGHTPSLMDYSRFNYVAQPEDGIPVEDLIPKIGPYDRWATMWGYKPVPGAKSPAEEKTTLDEWARAQDAKPYLRFSTAQAAGSDPGNLTEAVGDADAVKSTTLGLKNLERVSGMLMTATAQPGEPYDDLDEIYGRMLGQWATELNHVAAIVGGFQSQQKHWGQDGVRFTPIAKTRQAEAVQFINEHAFATPLFAIKPDILRRIEPDGVIERVGAAQQRVLNSLLSAQKIARLVEQEAIDGAAAYTATQFVADVRKGIWSELDAAVPKVDAYRRNLQRTYLDLIDTRLNGRQPEKDESRALYRGELRSLDASIRRAIVRTTDRATRLHLEDARDQIERILDPKVAAAPPAQAGARAPETIDGADIDGSAWPEGGLVCWPDDVIRRKKP